MHHEANEVADIVKVPFGKGHEYPNLYNASRNWEKSFKCERNQEGDKPLDQALNHEKTTE